MKLAALAFATVALLVAASVANATDYILPDQKITGAEQVVPLGELVDLGLTPIATKPQGWASASYAWKVIDPATGEEKRFRQVGDGILFGAGIVQRKLKVFVAASHLYAGPDGPATKVAFLSADVIIGGSPPDPSPVLPVGKYGLAAYAYQTGSQVAGDHTFARTMSGNFKAVAEAIKGGALKTPQDILAAAKAANDKTPEQQTEGWKAWLSALGDKLFALSQAGTLSSPDDYYQAFSEISAGLSAVK